MSLRLGSKQVVPLPALLRACAIAPRPHTRKMRSMNVNLSSKASGRWVDSRVLSTSRFPQPVALPSQDVHGPHTTCTIFIPKTQSNDERPGKARGRRPSPCNATPDQSPQNQIMTTSQPSTGHGEEGTEGTSRVHPWSRRDD